MFLIGFGSCCAATLECALDSVNNIMSDIDNFHLRKAFLCGKWLYYTFDVFCIGKDLSNVTFRSFEEWVQARTKIGKRCAYSLQNLAKLETIVPRILCYKLPVDFLRNYRQLCISEGMMLLSRGIIPWIVPVVNVKLIFLSSNFKIVFSTNIELYDCAVGLLFAIYHYMNYCSPGITLHNCAIRE